MLSRLAFASSELALADCSYNIYIFDCKPPTCANSICLLNELKKEKFIFPKYFVVCN